MHIQIDLRGYREETELIKIARQRLRSFIENDLNEILVGHIGYDNLEEDEEVMEVGWNEHIYPHPDYEEERYYVG